jgi:predicted AlkP superfamily phosphohydrolase/phosphomutase
VIALSPLGMTANTSRADFLPGMLDAVLGGGRPSRGTSRRGSLWGIRGAVPTSWRASVAAALPDDLALALTARLELRGVDWERTRAFAVPSDTNGYVRLNLRGRERRGIVAPADADALLDEIVAGLTTFVDESGRPAVAEVVRTAEALAPGAGRDLLPDLVVRWDASPSSGLRRMSSPTYGEVVRPGAGTGRSGNHDDEAWAVVCPGAARVRDPDRPLRLEDVAATALALLGGDPAVTSGEPFLERG